MPSIRTIRYVQYSNLRLAWGYNSNASIEPVLPMLTFALAVFFLIITPGPGVLSVAGIASGFGTRPAMLFLAGLCAGNNLVGLAVATGLAAAMMTLPGIREVLLFASIVYLAYLAFRIAFAGSKIAFMSEKNSPGFMGGFLLQFINPKCYAVNTTLFSGFAFMPEHQLMEIAL